MQTTNNNNYFGLLNIVKHGDFSHLICWTNYTSTSAVSIDFVSLSPIRLSHGLLRQHGQRLNGNIIGDDVDDLRFDCKIVSFECWIEISVVSINLFNGDQWSVCHHFSFRNFDDSFRRWKAIFCFVFGHENNRLSRGLNRSQYACLMPFFIHERFNLSCVSLYFDALPNVWHSIGRSIGKYYICESG